MKQNTNIVAEAKADVAAKQAQEKADQQAANKALGITPWYINLLIWIMDAAAAVGVLALAIVGALSLIQAELSDTTKIGIAALVVGLLASRLLERVFKVRR